MNNFFKIKMKRRYRLRDAVGCCLKDKDGGLIENMQ
jgi:hypothetical protein